MSHQATRWAVQQRGLKPATKIVLLMLADRHNPDFGCFPSHRQLAEDAEMSERSVRDHLRILEEIGLIRKLKRDRKNGEFSSSGYELAFERMENTQRQDLPEVDASDADSPTANSRDNQRQNLPTNPVKGTTQEGACARETFDFRDRLLVALGFPDPAAVGQWWSMVNVALHRDRWVALGLTDTAIIEAARESRKKHPRPPDGPKALDGFMARWARKRSRSSGRKAAKQQSDKAGPLATIDDQVALVASWFERGCYVPPSAVNPTIAHELVARGVTTESELRKLGIAA